MDFISNSHQYNINPGCRKKCCVQQPGPSPLSPFLFHPVLVRTVYEGCRQRGGYRGKSTQEEAMELLLFFKYYMPCGSNAKSTAGSPTSPNKQCFDETGWPEAPTGYELLMWDNFGLNIACSNHPSPLNRLASQKVWKCIHRPQESSTGL